MKENQSDESKIVINETVDGNPVGTRKASEGKNGKSKDDNVEKHRPDRYIWGVYLALLLTSVVELFSASSTEIKGGDVYGPLIRHSIFLALGFGIVVVFQNIHYKYFKNLAWVAGLITLGLLVYTMFAGAVINGAQRAIIVGGITIQPPEIAKLTIVLLLAAIMSRNQIAKGISNKGVILCALVVLFFCGFLVKNGMTNTILIFGISLSMFLIGGMQLKKIGAVLVVYGIFVGIYYVGSHSNDDEDDVQTEVVAGVDKTARNATWKNRIIRHIEGVHPQDTIDDYNRQVIYSCFAQANGGLIGEGPGNSQERARLPLAFSDYIYSIIVEDTGFVGGCLLLGLYLFLVARAGKIASKCSRAFPAILIMGCALMIVFQALVHMAITTGVFPVSGQPLPLISKGGTSVLVMSAAIGMMLSVSRFAVQNGNKKDVNMELNELPEDMQAANPTQLTYNDIKK